MTSTALDLIGIYELPTRTGPAAARASGNSYRVIRDWIDHDFLPDRRTETPGGKTVWAFTTEDLVILAAVADLRSFGLNADVCQEVLRELYSCGFVGDGAIVDIHPGPRVTVYRNHRKQQPAFDDVMTLRFRIQPREAVLKLHERS